ncbi:MAG: hypothetical protein K2V38_09285, partial [Gemmataceae bacterium]|nr:hypothetical protein [Gemmataceae bacterium]
RGSYLSVASGATLTNESTGVIETNTGTGDARSLSGAVVNRGAITTNTGATLLVNGTFTAAGGIVNGGGNTYFVGVSLAVTAPATSPTTLRLVTTNSRLTTDNLAGYTLWVEGERFTWGRAVLTATANTTNFGTIRLQTTSSDGFDRSSGFQIQGNFTNAGLFEIQPGTGDARYITGPATATFTNATAGRIGGSGTLEVRSGNIDTLGTVDPTVLITLPGNPPLVNRGVAARQTVPQVPGDGVVIDLFNQIGGGRAPLPSDVTGTPSGRTLSPYIDFPNPAQVVNVGSSFNSFFATTTTPPAQVQGLSAANFTLKHTFFLAVTGNLDRNPATPEIDIALGVGSDDGYHLQIGPYFIGSTGDRGFVYTWHDLRFAGEGLYPITLLYAANAIGVSGLEFAWRTAAAPSGVLVPQSALYTSPQSGDQLITFEELPAGTAVTNQFQSKGVLFNTLGGNLQVTSAQPARFVPVSGNRVFADPALNPTQTGVVEWSFVVPNRSTPGMTDFVAFYLIDAETTGATVTAFDPEGNMLFTGTYNAGAGTQERVVIGRPRIAKVRVTLGAGADTTAVDNLSFNRPVRAIPGASWDGGGDGVSWGDSRNWDTDVVPGPADDVTIDSPGLTVRSTNAVTVRSLTSNAALALDAGSLTLTGGTSALTGGLSAAVGTKLTASGAGTSVTVSGTTAIDGASLTTTGGATLALPGLTQFTPDNR